ncbi:hypothetical protein PGT21_000365, partial [Puccinia graminis f. sp. tritici]
MDPIPGIGIRLLHPIPVVQYIGIGWGGVIQYRYPSTQTHPERPSNTRETPSNALSMQTPEEQPSTPGQPKIPCELANAKHAHQRPIRAPQIP